MNPWSSSFLAVSNLPYGGPPPAIGRPCDELWLPEPDRCWWFPSQLAARDWLKNLRCGGSISTHREGELAVVETIPPDGDYAK